MGRTLKAMGQRGQIQATLAQEELLTLLLLAQLVKALAVLVAALEAPREFLVVEQGALAQAAQAPAVLAL